jgi:hypothetical protein
MCTWGLNAVHFVIAVLGVALPGALFSQSPSTEHIPQGWYVYPHSNLEHADENLLRCFNLSHNEWHVSIRPRTSGNEHHPSRGAEYDQAQERGGRANHAAYGI